MWQTRILGSGLGFVMAATGWWFILWLWAPIYGNVLSASSSSRCWATLGASERGGLVHQPQRHLRGLPDHDRAGRRSCLARHGGLRQDPEVGLLRRPGRVRGHRDPASSTTTPSFVSSFNQEAHKIFGVNNAYAGRPSRRAPRPATSRRRSGSRPLRPSMLLVPMMMFYLLWPNWGSTLYGEIRGASDFKRVFSGMFGGLWITVCCRCCSWCWSTRRWAGFYKTPRRCTGGLLRRQGAGSDPDLAVPGDVHRLAGPQPDLPGRAAPGHAPVVPRLGRTLFLSSTRVIFAAAFDRILPGPRRRGIGEAQGAVLLADPDAAPGDRAQRALRVLVEFYTYTLDATLVIAVTYLFSAIAVVLLPFVKRTCGRPRRPAGSSCSAALRASRRLVTIGLLGFNLYEWLTNATYGVNNRLAVLHGRDVRARASDLRGGQARPQAAGIDLGLINKEIPVE